jgi:5-methylthioadenosine/S-adenosylhomocysteine deaminase
VILVKGATIVAMDEAHGTKPFTGDVLVDGAKIVKVSGRIEARGAEVIDGQNRLLIPGLINAHAHSNQSLTRGRFPSMPLEIFAIYCLPRGFVVSPRLAYLRSLLLGMESLKSGVTCLLDDCCIFDDPIQSMEQLDAVFQAYDDLGIRANVTGHIVNKPYFASLPYADEIFPEKVRRSFAAMKLPTTASYIEFSEEAMRRFHGRANRLRYCVAPSGPQRCTEDLLVEVSQFSRRHGLPYHIHVLESKVQLVTAREQLAGRSFVEYLDSLGVLHKHVTMAHVVWVTDDDIGLMARADCSIVHNPICNLRLGSGVAPIRQLIDAGVNVALGTDELDANDRGPLFDVMHIAGLIHNLTSWDYERWPEAGEIFHAATIGGAKSVGLQSEIGSIEEGKRADLALLSLDSPRFTPLNDPVVHLVYAENGASVETVLVDGKVVVRHHELVQVSEHDVLDEVRQHYPQYMAEQERMEAMNCELDPYFAEMYRRCVEQEVGLQRVIQP